MRLPPLAESQLPHTDDELINDAGLAAVVGLPRSAISKYRRNGILPPYDFVAPGQGHGGWHWATVKSWAELLRTSRCYLIYNPHNKHRAVRAAAGLVWPDRAHTGGAE